MSLHDYLLGQMQQTLHSIESGQAETHDKIDALTQKVDGALTWAQRLVWLGLSILGAIGINWSPEQIGQLVAHVLKAARP